MSDIVNEILREKNTMLEKLLEEKKPNVLRSGMWGYDAGSDITANPVEKESPKIKRKPKPEYEDDKEVHWVEWKQTIYGPRGLSSTKYSEGEEVKTNTEQKIRSDFSIKDIIKPITSKEHFKEGYLYKGFCFTRPLNEQELVFLRKYGIINFKQKFPELMFKKEEKVQNKTEEGIVIIHELADYYSQEECRREIENFSLENHSVEYSKILKKHLKIIKKHLK